MLQKNANDDRFFLPIHREKVGKVASFVFNGEKEGGGGERLREGEVEGGREGGSEKGAKEEGGEGSEGDAYRLVMSGCLRNRGTLSAT